MKIKDLPKEILSDMFVESGLRVVELPILLEYDISNIDLEKRTLMFSSGLGTERTIKFSTNVINGVKHCIDETIKLSIGFKPEWIIATILFIMYVSLVIYFILSRLS